MHRVFRRHLPTEATVRQWLGDHPLVARILARSGFLSIHRRALARGVAVGLLVGLTPTVGVQTILMILLCVWIRASFPAAFLVSWVSNPLTAPALYFAFNRLGEAVFGRMLAPLLPTEGLVDEATRQTLYLALGSGLIALPVALLGYGLFLAGWRYSVVSHRWPGGRSRGQPRDGGDGPGGGTA
ncbi:DUF2062 domain-containing protein [Thiohalorhabdus sp.]|uniref:DUF2062 domain-containing protein n=1 Tax=Thiohalorhabdus sp. TaxID=3094134 RepID=UPI002FC3A85F